MKRVTLILKGLILCFSISANNQIEINEKTCVHLICPVAVAYVQVGDSDKMMAEVIEDFPNIVRIQARESFSNTSSLTIVCQDQLYAFEVRYNTKCPLQLNLSNYKGETVQKNALAPLPLHELHDCMDRLLMMEGLACKAKTHTDNVELCMQAIRVHHNLIFVRLDIQNRSNTIYRAEQPVFLMRDKHPKKASNVQEYLLEPIEQSCKELFIAPQNQAQMVLVFNAFTIPDHKEVEILLHEHTDGYTGRDLSLNFSHKTIRKAHSF